MSKIVIDIDELADKLESMREDDYVLAEIEIEDDGYDKVMNISAVSFDSDEPLSYGSIYETSDELL